jgi:hypothetical protein
LVASLPDPLQQERAAAWARFRAAAAASLTGDHSLSLALIARVRERHGDEVAEQQATELRKYIARERKNGE